MKVKELLLLLADRNPEDDVVVDVDCRSIYPLSTVDSKEYNQGNDTAEFFLVAAEWGDNV